MAQDPFVIAMPTVRSSRADGSKVWTCSLRLLSLITISWLAALSASFGQAASRRCIHGVRCHASHVQDNFKKYGDGAGFVEPAVAKTIVSAGPQLQANGHA